jgi:hypothetical protein
LEISKSKDKRKLVSPKEHHMTLVKTQDFNERFPNFVQLHASNKKVHTRNFRLHILFSAICFKAATPFPNHKSKDGHQWIVYQLLV